MTAKEQFKIFSKEHQSSLPFSLHYDWWNEVVQEDWEVAIVANQNGVKAIWPYFFRKKGIWKFLANPHFTPYTGPYLSYPEGQKNESKIAYEHKIYAELIDQLPPFSELSQNFHLGFSNSLAFHWKGFNDEKRFTYLLDLNQSEDSLWKNFRENNRRQIRKAEKSIAINRTDQAVLLESLLKQSYEKQTTPYPNFPSQYFERIVNYVSKHQCGQLFSASDAEDNIHACLLCIWDEQSAYYLIGGSANAYKNSGAMSLLIWYAIRYAKKEGIPLFNFEGSSIEAIEKYLRGFGGELSTLSRISKLNSSSLGALKKLK